jgi:hypothetical protein
MIIIIAVEKTQHLSVPWDKYPTLKAKEKFHTAVVLL